MNWRGAVAACAQRGAALVTVADTTENEWILDRLLEVADDQDWWLGIADEDADGRFEWIAGDSAFSAWREPPEPGRCGMFDDITATSRDWWAAPCDRIADGYVCAQR